MKKKPIKSTMTIYHVGERGPTKVERRTVYWYDTKAEADAASIKRRKRGQPKRLAARKAA
ncbi:MAG: hypothetical protein IT462_09155 [Planctomycetes bacterium]|nr:hypothetical protein [Planctomycetota bacterium]